MDLARISVATELAAAEAKVTRLPYSLAFASAVPRALALMSITKLENNVKGFHSKRSNDIHLVTLQSNTVLSECTYR
jgi:hypothetical protein